MTPEGIRSTYSFRVLDMLERAAKVVRTSGFQVPKPVLADTVGSTNHTFWWTDVEDQKNKILQLQFMAAVSEEVIGKSGELRFSFCLFDLQFGRIVGCRESQWVDRNDPETVEQAFVSVESRLPVLLAQLKKLADGLRG